MIPKITDYRVILWVIHRSIKAAWKRRYQGERS